MHPLHDFITEYTTSEYFMLLNTTLKEHAEGLLEQFCSAVDEPISIVGIEAALTTMAPLDIPLPIRKEIPKLVAAFFDFIGSTGRDPRALRWADDAALLQKSYLAMLRDDGTVRGVTYEKKAAETGRNDPCPCGSGKKFKKCCG